MSLLAEPLTFLMMTVEGGASARTNVVARTNPVRRNGSSAWDSSCCVKRVRKGLMKMKLVMGEEVRC